MGWFNHQLDHDFCLWPLCSSQRLPSLLRGLLRAIFRLHPSLKDVKVYEGLVDDPEVTIEGVGVGLQQGGGFTGLLVNES